MEIIAKALLTWFALSKNNRAKTKYNLQKKNMQESWEKTDRLYMILAPQFIWTKLKTKLDDINFSTSC